MDLLGIIHEIGPTGAAVIALWVALKSSHTREIKNLSARIVALEGAQSECMNRESALMNEIHHINDILQRVLASTDKLPKGVISEIRNRNH